MSTFCKSNANWPPSGGGITLPQFNDFMDLTLVSGTAYRTKPEYPVEFGQEPGIVIIQADKEFSVLTDWLGNVLVQGFES